jgi:hypothetical protein
MGFRRSILAKPRFLVAIVLAAVVFVANWASAQEPAGGSTLPLPAPSNSVSPMANSPFELPPAVIGGAGDGANKVEQSAMLLRTVGQLQCAVRCRTDMSGLSAVGAGTYAQSDVGGRRRVRLELDLSVGENLRAEFLQVSDGDVMWVRKRLPEKETLERLRLQRLRKELSADATVDPRIQIAEGGLSRLLFAMNEAFAFGPPRQDTLEGEPVWVVEGLWKPEKLAARYPAIAESLSLKKVVSLASLPERTPTGARLYLRRNDPLKYFPHRVEFTRQETSHPQSASRTLLQYDLFEVREPATIDDALFNFDPQGQPYVDRTETFRGKHFPGQPRSLPQPQADAVPGELTAGRPESGVR